MYLAIDIGGTKTLVAALDNEGVIKEQLRFPTPKNYREFLSEVSKNVDNLSTKDFVAACIAAPGRFDRSGEIVIAFGNLPWSNVPMKADVSKILRCPVTMNNDAKLAALSESMLLKDEYQRVLYITISTGIGIGLVVNQKIDIGLEYAEAGDMLIEHNGKLEHWEKFASGKAIVKRFGKKASEIEDPEIWRKISRDMAIGLADLAAVIQPDVIVIGGSVGVHFNKYGDMLKEELKKFEVPMLPIPPVIEAGRPTEAVIYGCYDYAKEKYGS